MVENRSKENRSFVRADMSFQVKYRVVTREEYQAEIQNINNKACSEEDTILFKNAHQDNRVDKTAIAPSLVRFLNNIDEKLDQILALLSKDKTGISDYQQGTGLNIGGNGLKMAVDTPVELGDIIQMNFTLSKLDLIHFDLFGEVVRVNMIDQEGGQIYHLMIKLLSMNEKDREKIIATIFQKQRQEIRKTKTIETKD